jgi:hypothetical protein
VANGGPGASELASIAAAWSLRGRAPVVAMSTLSLLEILRGGGNEGALGLLLVRLVNGVTDSAQAGVMAASVADLARRIGFPRWIVDLRHDLSHGTLPDVPVLRLAASHCVQWLLERYWRPQAASLAAATGSHTAAAICATLAAIAATPSKNRVATISRRRSGGNPSASPRDAGSPQSERRLDARLVLFSKKALRAVGAVCGGDFSRLIVEKDTAMNARDALRVVAVDPTSLLDAATCGTHQTSLVALAASAIRSSAAGFEWIDAALIGPLVAAPGFLFSPSSPAASHASSSPSQSPFATLLPPSRSRWESMFRAWVPFIFSIEMVAPGATRLLARALVAAAKRDDNPERAAAADAWLWLLRSRYWHSLFDWSLLIAPRRRGVGADGAADLVYISLHSRSSWNVDEASWAFSSAPEATLLGLECSSSGAVTVNWDRALSHYLPCSAIPEVALDASVEPAAGPWNEIMKSAWYDTALRAPITTLPSSIITSRYDLSMRDVGSATVSSESLDIDAIEKLLETEVESRQDALLPKRPRWSM